MFTIDNWIDYKVSLIPDPLIIDNRIQTTWNWLTYMNCKEYYRRLYLGEYPNGSKSKGRNDFVETMIHQSGWLFKQGVWKKIRLTKKYYQNRLLLAPLCSGGCGRKIMEFSEWGECVPFHLMKKYCSKCSKIK
jgi:hypothetical protein